MYKNILFLLIFFLLANCKKEDKHPEESTPRGNATALKNGDVWNAVTWSKHSYPDPPKFNLLIENYSADGSRRGSLQFSHAPFENGKFYFNAYQYNPPSESDNIQTCAFYTLLSDGDVAGDTYRLTRDSASWLTVRITDGNSGDIEGEFSAEFVKILFFGEELDPSSPDTIVFTNGTYKARVQKR